MILQQSKTVLQPIIHGGGSRLLHTRLIPATHHICASSCRPRYVSLIAAQLLSTFAAAGDLAGSSSRHGRNIHFDPRSVFRICCIISYILTTTQDLTPEARLLYSSESVIDILGYTPDELVNRSCWDFFPAQEIPYARKFHQERVIMDKAAVLVYCSVKSKEGEWIGCECCFTIVYDVMIVCTSRYRQGESSQGRY